MIKFFRRIRKDLLSEEKTGKPALPVGRYLNYALGEIILVVIGILIALQINNWNEAKKAKKFELKMLEELRQALSADQDHVEEHLLGYRNLETIKSVKYFHDLLRGQERPIDSLRYYFDWLTYGLTFQVNLGPYESLKSMGIEKISNDSLRNQIVYFYDFVVPRARDFIAFSQQGREKDMERKHSLMEPYTYEVIDDEVSIFRPTPNRSVIEDPKFLELLSNSEKRSNSVALTLTNYLSRIKPLKDNIELELRK